MKWQKYSTAEIYPRANLLYRDQSPFNEKFQDIYFSGNGYSETMHVFIEGNQLYNKWSHPGIVAIGELGFGTGLNFYLTYNEFLRTAHSNSTLYFVSCEKYPLPVCEMQNFWNSQKDSPCFLPFWPGEKNIGGFQRISYFENRVTLHIIFDDVYNAYRNFIGNIDAWYFDGFNEKNNPEMWSESLFRQLRRKSHPHTTFATYACTGNIKKNLKAAQWDYKRVKGHAEKKHMLIGSPLRLT